MSFCPPFPRASFAPRALSHLALATAIGALALHPAAAQGSAAPVDIAIGAQPLALALNELARQAGLTLMVAPALVTGKVAPPVSGRMPARQALEHLLAGTGLAASIDGSTVVIRTAGGGASLPPVTVLAEAERETAWGPAGGYLARLSATGTKTDTPIIETPQSISVVTAEQVEAQKPQSVVDALAYTAGVSVRESGRVTESFVLRGFQADGQSGSLYRDGTKYSSNLYQGQQEPYGMERIELLRGASSVLYGNAAPGGVINTVSKRPVSEPLRELNLEFGSFQRQQVSGDFGGRLSDDGAWSYRLTGLARDSGSFVDQVPDNRTFIAPAVSWRPSAATAVTLLANFKETESKYLYGLPTIGTIQPSRHGRLPRSRFLGEPGADRYTDHTASLGYLLEHAFSEHLKLRQNVRLDRSRTTYAYTYHFGLADAGQRVTDRGFDQADTQHQAITADTSLQWQWGTPAQLAHTTLVGIDHARQKEVTQRYGLKLPSFDLFDPTYGAVPSDPSVNIYAADRVLKRTGVYLQDQMKFNRQWVALLGGRYDWTENALSPIAGDRSWSHEKNNAFTGRAGLVYLADNGLAPFLSFSQSFEPAAGLGRSGERFKPTRGRQYEAGLRYQPPGSETLLTASVYQLTQQNVLTLDPVNIAYQIQTGEKKSQGVELEAKARVARHLSVLAAYAYTDARTTRSNTASEVGAPSPFTPRHQASLWVDYALAGWDLAGMKVGAGVRHAGRSTGFAYLKADVPGYTVFDAMVSYTTGPWRLALNVSNVADKTYIANCTYGCFYGEARRVTGTASYRW